jgi:hypothetical protein
VTLYFNYSETTLYSRVHLVDTGAVDINRTY